MKKKRGKKKIVSPKKKKVFFLFGNKTAPVVLAAVFLALVILLPFFTTGNAVNASVTGKASFLDNPVSVTFSDATSWLNMGGTWKDVLVYLIVLVIIFVMLVDMLMLTSIFSNWVVIVIAAGISIVGALTNVIRQIALWFMTITAGIGILGGFIEIIIAIVMFVGLAFGSSKIAIFAAKRKAQKERLKAIKTSGQASAAITGLRTIQTEFRKRTP